MSSVEGLREFITERLSAAAQEIFGVFRKTIVEYEEEIHRLRGLLEVAWTPEIKLHRIDGLYTEEKVLANLQPDRNYSLDQEKLLTSPEGELLVLKQENDALILTTADEEKDQNEPVPASDHQLLFANSAISENQEQTGKKHRDSGSTSNAEYESKNMSKTDFEIHTGKNVFICETCGKDFKYRSKLHAHQRIHMVETPYCCDKCGKFFKSKCGFLGHMRVHTGEMPYTCKTCGKRFISNSGFIHHMRIHTGEKPYLCNTCGKSFTSSSTRHTHLRVHTGEKPYSCTECKKSFSSKFNMLVHMRIHTGEKPFSCKPCGKFFRFKQSLLFHLRAHR